MFWNKGKLTTMLREVEGIESLIITTAYFSDYGLSILKSCIEKNHLNKENVTLFLSTEFSTKSPSLLLKRLSKIAKVFIVTKENLHAKVYIFKYHDRTEVVYGSANFTRGGFESNLEFINKEILTDSTRIEMFVKYCTNASEEVTDEIITAYLEKEEFFNSINSVRETASNKIASIFRESDPFTESEYSLEDKFFNFHDFETLFSKYQQDKSIPIMERRKTIQTKMLEINNILLPRLKELNLHNHWSLQNITSLLRPSIYNHNRVGWIGIRYGKKENEVKFLNSSYGIDTNGEDYSSFQKHACMQFSIVPDGISIGLFHAVANDAIDRKFLHENLDSRSDEIIKNINAISGEGFVWNIYDNKNNETVMRFNADEEAAENFINFYKKYDRDGYESFMTYHINPDDVFLSNAYEIAKVVERKMKLLLPLYNTIVYRAPSLKSFS
ncbi:phospholipase D family protein [Terribacillus saccharophilus]|uniref:phospholipase D family protein n=1 Tax=Terribacillus saccharophilus TaxID=361277 RepID=UPI002989B8A2|nr:phospholipase D family protein [Terribacillus saccharophilus]MCM3225262.1 phospholipase D family protein [Terribacillus saccharophilus]